MRTEITSERAADIGGSTEAPPKFQDIQVVADETTPEVWVQNPPRPGRGRPTPYVQGLEFIVRRLANMLESALGTVKTLRRDVQRAKDDAAEAARVADRENRKLTKDNEDLRRRVLDLEAAEATHNREMNAKNQELEERAGQVREAQGQVRLRDEREQELLDDASKAHAEQLAGLRAEQEREIDQLNESHRQIVEATEQDAKAARNELQELRELHEVLKEREQDLQNANESLEFLAQQSYNLVKLIASVSVIISPLRYVIFVDDAEHAVEDPTYVFSKDGDIEIVPSKVLIHGQTLALDYTPGEQPSLAGLALLNWLQKAASGTGNTPEELENCPQLLRLTFDESAAQEQAAKTSEEDE